MLAELPSPLTTDSANPSPVGNEYARRLGVGASVFPASGISTTMTQIAVSFSWREHAPQLLSPVVNQGRACGVCWAVAAVGCLADRVALRLKRRPNFLFEELVLCAGVCEPCKTCLIVTGFEHLLAQGLRASASLDAPRQAAGALGLPGSQSQPEHFTSCENIRKLALQGQAPEIFSFKGSVHRASSILAMKHAIAEHGPVASVMRVFQDFVSGSEAQRKLGLFGETGGIYIHRHGETNYGVPPSKNADLGAHAVVVVGWGQQNGVDYWEIRNSWGAQWADGGYCRVAMTATQLKNEAVGIDLARLQAREVNGAVNAATHFGNVYVTLTDIHIETPGKPTHLYGSTLGKSQLTCVWFCVGVALALFVAFLCAKSSARSK